MHPLNEHVDKAADWASLGRCRTFAPPLPALFLAHNVDTLCSLVFVHYLPPERRAQYFADNSTPLKALRTLSDVEMLPAADIAKHFDDFKAVDRHASPPVSQMAVPKSFLMS